jgi:NAD-dependent dihydropyrimidine dehydrogenase PreA subunit
MPEVEIDYGTCISCKTCVSTCPMGVYEEKNEQVVVAAPQDCITCMGCVGACPVGAITVTE